MSALRALGAATLVLLTAPTVVRAQGLRSYEVQPGDSCRSIARAVYGDRERIDVIHAHNRWLGAPPHRLRPGTRLQLPSPEAVRHEARVAWTQNRVERRSPQAEAWLRARRGDGLDQGHQIATAERSAAELSFRDGSRLQMRERSLVVLLDGGRVQRRRRATLERGSLRARLAELAGAPVEVATATARAELRGDGVVTVDDEGASRVANHEGELTVRGADGGRVRVPEGSGAVVRPGQRPSRPRPLPRAPRWRDDRAGRFVGVTGTGGSLRAGWHPVDGAQRYRVEVARRPDGTDLFAALELDASRTHFTLHRVPAGAYYLSVATIDGHFFESRPSPRRAVVVREARIVPPGGGDPPPDTFDPGDPTRAFTPPHVLPGTWLVAPLGYRCGLGADDALAGIATLRTLGRHHVRCLDGQDREVPGFEVVVVNARVRVRGRPAIRRGGRRTLRLRVSSPLRLPDRLIAQAPRGIAVGSILREPDGDFRVEVGAAVDAPAHVRIQLQVAAGTERITIGELTLTVVGGNPVARGN